MTDERHAADDLERRKGQFARSASTLTHWTGSGGAALLVLVVVAVWLAVGPLVDYARAWELSVVAGVPVLTLLMLVIVQHTQNHDDRAVQLKLDEVIRALEGSTNRMMGIEEGGEGDLRHLGEHFRQERG